MTITGRGEMVLVAPSSLKVQTMAELLALARAGPGQLTYGTIGIGSLSHFAGALLAKAASIDVQDVPLQGNNEVLLDLIGERIQLSFDFPATSVLQIAAGKLRGLNGYKPAPARIAPEGAHGSASWVPGP